MAYNTENLISIIKKRAFMPDTQETFTPEDLLEMATDEMRDNIVPQIKSTREEYFLVSSDHTFTDGGYIRIPPRAIGGSLREITIVQGNNEYNLSRKTVEDKRLNAGRIVNGFYIQGNKVYIMSGGSGTVRLYYYIRPSELILPSKATKVASIDTVTGVITTDNIPDGWGSNNIVDFIEAQSGFDLLGLDVECTVGANQITISPADIPEDLQVGDWISLRDTAPVPQIPPEFFPYLAQAVAVQVLESVGDFEAKEAAEQKLMKIEKNITAVISPRVEGEGKRFITSRNKGSFYNRWRG